MPNEANNAASSANTILGKVTNMMTTPEGIAVTTTTAAGLLLFVGTQIYQRLTAQKPLSTKELQGYNILVTAYRQRERDRNHEIPLDWVLDNNVVRNTIDFASLAKTLDTQSSSYNSGQGVTLTSTIQTMLGNISSLFRALSRRTTDLVSGGSIDAMFFVEVSHWLLNKTQEPESFINKIQAMRHYCATIREQNILKEETNRANRGQEHPRKTLDNLIENLVSLEEVAVQASRYQSMVTGLKALKDSYYNLVHNTFRFMFHLIQGSNESANAFEVADFINPGKKAVPKEMTKIKERQLGLWLLETFSVLGIQDGRFQATKIPSSDETERHLQGQIPTDENAAVTLRKAFHDPRYHGWGHWPFITNNSFTNQKVYERLESIRTLHRSIINMYRTLFFLESFIHTGEMYGESWMCISQGGSSAYDCLILLLDKLVKDIEDNIKIIMTPINKCYEAANQRRPYLDNSTEKVAMKKILEIQKEITGSLKTQGEKKLAISDLRTSFKTREEETKINMYKMYIGIAHMMVHHQMTNNRAYQHIAKEAKKIELTDEPATRKQLLEKIGGLLLADNTSEGEPTASAQERQLILRNIRAMIVLETSGNTVEVNIDTLPLYKKLRALLNLSVPFRSILSSPLEGDRELTLPSPVTHFGCPVQLSTYQFFLTRYLKLIQLPDLFSVFWIPRDKTVMFRDIFRRINEALRWIHSPDSNKATTAAREKLDEFVVAYAIIQLIKKFYCEIYQDPQLRIFYALAMASPIKKIESSSNTTNQRIVLTMDNKFSDIAHRALVSSLEEIDAYMAQLETSQQANQKLTEAIQTQTAELQLSQQTNQQLTIQNEQIGAQKITTVDALNTEVNELAQDRDSKLATIHERDATISYQQQALTTANARIKTLEGTVTTQTTEIATLKTQNAQQLQVNQGLAKENKSHVEQNQRLAAEKEAQIEQNKRLAAEKEAQIKQNEALVAENKIIREKLRMGNDSRVQDVASKVVSLRQPVPGGLFSTTAQAATSTRPPLPQKGTK